jgi:hypothetical protein
MCRHEVIAFALGVAAVLGSGSCQTRDTVAPPMVNEAAADPARPAGKSTAVPDPAMASAQRMIAEGRRVFRFDTFGDEAFWGATIGLHKAVQGQAYGGTGAGLTPKAALTAGLKVDAEALPGDLVAKIKAGKVDLESVDTTLALLKLDAVVGVKGVFGPDGKLNSIGITCAFCHSTVDDSFSAGIGKRLDGWPNRDLNVGAVVGMAPDLSVISKLLGVPDATVRKVLASWGPGKYDALLLVDGKALRPDGKAAATLLPPAFGLAGVNLHTWTGWGSVPYWNAYVANTQMHGQGTFFDPRLDDKKRFPIAAKNKPGRTRSDKDQVTGKLASLHFYQLALDPPTPPAGSFDAAKAKRGETVFTTTGRCASCHVPPLYTEPGWNLHTAEEIGIDDFQAKRSPDGRYRTAPLRGLFAHSKGGFYHDGRFATLAAVVDHYDRTLKLQLTAEQKTDLVEFLKSL